mmetsp:Transcript_5881/g.11210  ORF Transcript_5881/g.11210 Transcript_5881/m.11210 type:complete len:734 (-) Transcript_5881:283-2484(-)
MSSVINVKPVRNAENNVHPVQSNKKHMTIKLANLNLDADGDGMLDEKEMAILNKLKGMDVDGDGEIGLSELCSLANTIEDVRQANKDMTRILFGVILLALSSTIVCFFAAWAANEAAKDTRPDSDGKLKTVGGDMISTVKFEKSMPLSDLATLTSESLDKMTKLKYKLGGKTELFTVTGYSLQEMSASQRSVTFFTGRGATITCTVENSVGTASVTFAGGRTQLITSATTTNVGGRRKLLAPTNPNSTALTDDDSQTYVVMEYSSCQEFYNASAFERPPLGGFTMCEAMSAIEGGQDQMCCWTGSVHHLLLSHCGTSRMAHCRLAAVPMQELDSVYPGLEAPRAGMVGIWSVDAAGVPAFLEEAIETAMPWQCNPTEHSFLCIYGVPSAANTLSTAVFHMPEEAAPHECTWMAFAAKADVWGSNATLGVQEDLARLATVIAAFEPVKMLVSPEDMSIAYMMIGTNPNITLVEHAVNDLWMRDTGPILVTDDNNEHMRAVDFNFNGWGGKRQHALDATVASRVAMEAGADLAVSPLVLEGGCVEVNGQGMAIITESCLLNPNRNPGVTKDQAEVELKARLGLSKIIWLPGIAGADTTDGHTSMFARFSKPGTVIVSMPSNPEQHSYNVSHQHLSILGNSTDLEGNSLTVVEMPGPTIPSTQDWDAQFAVTYVNFYVFNDAVICPEFGMDEDDDAEELLREQFPGREVIPIRLDFIVHLGMGGIHSTVLQQPKIN